MRTYELTLVFDPEFAKDKKKPLAEVKKLLAVAEGKIVEKEEWGERPLAYPIDKREKGWYLFLRVELDETKIGQLDRKILLNEKILRHLLLRVK